MVGQRSLPGLFSGSHDCTESNFDFADNIKVACAISVDHLQLVVLNLLEEIGDSETVSEVRVEGVLDLLSGADLAPLATDFLKKDALGVRLGKSIQVFELTS